MPAGLKGRAVGRRADLANPVAFWIDDRGRIFVCETFRQGRGVEDNRGHEHWLDDDLAAQTVEDRLAYIKKHLGDKASDYTKHDDRIRLLEDTDGDGRADKATVFADRFNDIVDGTAAGVLARGDDVYLHLHPAPLAAARRRRRRPGRRARRRSATATACASPSAATTCTAW